ncbi:WAS/WASL-interacting protein family member 2-like [Corvus cornix cornix]|uniref:WAS/WASL-interacting protein family member 2-like n=1 Tax=Corvus cornix cornix TaxID=932674 RepID=UPI00194DEA9B|nr:WAS/WASL-interacting protein family member 2-like [Corvus cornix cornix]
MAAPWSTRRSRAAPRPHAHPERLAPPARPHALSQRRPEPATSSPGSRVLPGTPRGAQPAPPPAGGLGGHPRAAGRPPGPPAP